MSEIAEPVATARTFLENNDAIVQDALERAITIENESQISCDNCGFAFESAPQLTCPDCGVLLGGWSQIVHDEAKQERKDRYNQQLSGKIAEHNSEAQFVIIGTAHRSPRLD